MDELNIEAFQDRIDPETWADKLAAGEEFNMI